MCAPDKIATPSDGRKRGGGVRMRGGGVIGSVRGTVSGSGSGSRRLSTINGKILRSRGKGDGSKACMYPGGIKPIGFGVSWDPVDGEPMLGNAMGLPKPAWPIGITPEDVRIHAKTEEPVVLQDPMLEPLARRTAQYEQRMAERRSGSVQNSVQNSPVQKSPVQKKQVHKKPIQKSPVQKQPVQRTRESERIKQLMFNRPPSPGPGLTEDDAISLE